LADYSDKSVETTVEALLFKWFMVWSGKIYQKSSFWAVVHKQLKV